MKKRQQSNGQYSNNIPSLMDETPISFYPSLAEVIGVNETIVLQQIWFYINVNRENESDRHFHEGKWWVYNSYKQWAKKFFRWLTPRGVQSIILHLEELKILESVQGVSDKYDRRKWYTVNRDVLDAVIEEHYSHDAKNVSSHSAESVPSLVQKMHPLNMQNLHVEKTENTTEITTEKEITTPAATRQTHVPPSNNGEWEDVAQEADDPAMFVPKGKKEMSARAENGANRLSKDTATTSPSPSPLPAADVKSAQAFSAGMKDDVPADKGTKKRKPNRTAQIIDSVWGKGVSGGLLPMLMGRAKRKPHADYNIEDGMTEIEIFAFSRWYRKQNPGLNMPEIPYKVHDSIESFRNAMDYDGWMDEAERYILGYFPKEETAPAALVEERATPEEIAAYKQQIIDSGLSDVFGDMFDEYVPQENIS